MKIIPPRLTVSDFDKITEMADDLFRSWQYRSGGTPMTIMSQDSYDYWVMVATERYLEERNGNPV
jgi:hypothetical protein